LDLTSHKFVIVTSSTMPTPLDRALQSRSAFLGFAGIVTAVAAWSIWYGTIFPQAHDLLSASAKLKQTLEQGI
jgi:hypothetical protein